MSNNKSMLFTITLNPDKLTAVQAFMDEKGLDIQSEFEAFFEALFKKHVPKNVQIYINKMCSLTESSQKKPGKPKQNAVQKSLVSGHEVAEIQPEKTDQSEIENHQNEPSLQYTPPLPYDRFERNKDNSSNE